MLMRLEDEKSFLRNNGCQFVTYSVYRMSMLRKDTIRHPARGTSYCDELGVSYTQIKRSL